MNVTVRTYQDSDVNDMVRIWNEVVEEGAAFPQEEPLTEKTGRAFFREQTHCGVAVNEAGKVLGMYILHPNNVGRCGHICNTSYAVSAEARGLHIGEQIVKDSQSSRVQNPSIQRGGGRERSRAPSVRAPGLSPDRHHSPGLPDEGRTL